MVRPAFDIAQLTVPERLALMADLWASLAASPEGLPLSPTERHLIEERLAEHLANPEAAIPWEVVRAELLTEQGADEAEQGRRQPDRFERGG